MIVADTNLIAYLLINGDHTPLAEIILKKDADWVAPLLWRSELQNVLALYVRQKNMPVAKAVQIMATAEQVMQKGSYQPPSEKVTALVAASNCSAYDCEFVALAQDLRIPLVTSDKRVLKDFPQTPVSLSLFADR